MAKLPEWLTRLDPVAGEQWMLAGDDELLSLIGHVADHDRLPDAARIVTRFGDIATVRIPRRALESVVSSGAFETLEGARRLSEPEDLETTYATDGIESPYRSRPAGISQDGSGVVVGVIDAGIDFAHPAFLLPGNGDHGPRSKIRAIWDQRSNSLTAEPNRWGYGRVLERPAIEAALATEDPYEALDYRPSDSDRNARGAHGTHVAGIAIGSPIEGDHAGVAPGADLVFVHLSRTNPVLGQNDSDLGDAAALLEAIDFIIEQAGDQPVVINLSLGAHSGHHNGRSQIERGIDAALWQQPGRALVNSAGNYRKKRAHAQGRLQSGESTTLDFRLRPADRNGSELEVFYGARDRMSARVRMPDGRWTEPVAAQQMLEINDADNSIGTVFHRHSHYDDDHHLRLFLRPDAPSGDWQLELTAHDVDDGRFHAWIERDASQQPRFIGRDVEERSTIGTLANGRFSITVGAYDPHDPSEPLGDFSSLGPTRHGRQKPELAAPGVAIVAARSAPRDGGPAPRLTAMSGTSMAAPTVAGAVALLFGDVAVPLEITDTRALLLQSLRQPHSCRPDACRKHDIHGIGHGYLDIPRLLAAGATWSTTMTTDTESAAQDAPDTIDNTVGDAEGISGRLAHIDLPDDEPVGAADAALQATSEPALGWGHVGSLLVRHAPGEGVDYRAVVLSEPSTTLDRFAELGARIEQRGPGYYAEVLELGQPDDLAGRTVRMVFNEFGLLPRGQSLVPPALLKAVSQELGGDDDLEAQLPTETEPVGDALPDLSPWQDLISFRPPTHVQRSLVRRLAPDWSVHRIEDAHGDINIDYYPVRIDSLPTWRGTALTPEGLLALVRSDINRFIDTSIAAFRPYDVGHAARWATPSPLGAVVHIDMKAFGGWVNPDDGSVVCSDASPRDWTFSTIWTPGDFGHPVSGNRQFGIRQRRGGSWEFYTRGADRTTGRLDNVMSGTVFGAADALWVSLQRRVARFVNSNGGTARTLPRMSSRYPWPAVQRRYWRPRVAWI